MADARELWGNGGNRSMAAAKLTHTAYFDLGIAGCHGVVIAQRQDADSLSLYRNRDRPDFLWHHAGLSAYPANAVPDCNDPELLPV
ncbi:hypothetical protein [Leptolyngbya sp. 7M]|uniref:hypothetical protein n=1 Tax=Leptolyngbya sp. 7M TaxID=2812896 RepID=UPI001B8B771E|nr:hypothetical protein [Leptolyngbya sp. 7M]QYO64111.1 hypothetical protein JVX88_30830 [Leptolyngbya sp. 7M]